MKTYIKLIVACFLIIVALSLTSCQSCVHSHDVVDPHYTQQCVAYDNDWNCTANKVLQTKSVTSQCDEWKS